VKRLSVPAPTSKGIKYVMPRNPGSLGGWGCPSAGGQSQLQLSCPGNWGQEKIGGRRKLGTGENCGQEKIAGDEALTKAVRITAPGPRRGKAIPPPSPVLIEEPALAPAVTLFLPGGSGPGGPRGAVPARGCQTAPAVG